MENRKYLNIATKLSFHGKISNKLKEKSAIEGNVSGFACGLAFEETTEIMTAPLDLTVNTVLVKDRKLETPAKVKLIKLSENQIKDCLMSKKDEGSNINPLSLMWIL